ncbi:MAG: N-acetylmuramoyl-L-alanine amidase [Candidatus Electryoneaceae bacterium]|nr:N-acetylmuramoyl-L-alanine amidase [Candidatus Electryoneaceae bacterium]
MTAILTTLYLSVIFATVPTIDVVYPRPDGVDTVAYIYRVESNFIFGSVTFPQTDFSVRAESYGLSINGQSVSLYPNGAFIAYLPVDWNDKVYRLTSWCDGDTTHLSVPFDDRIQRKRRIVVDSSVADSSGGESDEIFPCLLELTGGGKVRNDPRGTYYMFPDSMTQIIADGRLNSFYQLDISADRTVWIADRYVNHVAPVPPQWRTPVVRAAWLEPAEQWIDLRIPIKHKVLYRLWDETSPDRIVLEFYGVISHLDAIAHRPGTDFINGIRWDEPADETLRLEISLSGPSWGYKTRWEKGNIILSIKKPPRLRRGVKGLHIAIDPGHGGDDYGAIGPTRLTEKEVNLRVALILARLLQRKGADVMLTLSDDSTLGLNDRVEIAEEAEADILISIHHNAMHDGANVMEMALGTGTYFYRPQSRDLASALQMETVEMFGLPDEGIYYKDLALVRPTAMPAVLIEAAYMMLPEQEILIQDPRYSQRLAFAIYKGIKQFAKERRRQQ